MVRATTTAYMLMLQRPPPLPGRKRSHGNIAKRPLATCGVCATCRLYTARITTRHALVRSTRRPRLRHRDFAAFFLEKGGACQNLLLLFTCYLYV